MQDLVALIDERMGRLENRASRMHHHHLLSRIDGLRNDARYAFMFENANVGGDTMGEILTYLFRLEPNGQPLTVLQLAGLPVEVVDAVVSLLSRLAFDFGLWSDGAMPMLFVCEEAHRYASVDRSVGFAPTRRALLRIAKEGRKYGVCLGLVTQRPAELDPTIISQCSTLFAMRMVNDRDQALLRSAVTDAAANLVAFVPSLGTREVVGFGEGFPLPTRLSFKLLAAERVPRSETFREVGPRDEVADAQSFVKQVVERWRGAAGAKLVGREEPAAEATSEPRAAPLSPSSNRLDQIRAQLLRR
jgi:DNA helicase HerA-like ATPase